MPAEVTFDLPSGERHYGYGATLNIGHLVVKVLGYASTQDRYSEPIRPPDDLAVQIWPLEAATRTWPPQKGLNNEGIEALAGESFV
jgi:hypothetical protein